MKMLLVLFVAITEMVPDLIWAPDFFGPQEIWALRNLGPKNFGPRMKKPCDDFYAELYASSVKNKTKPFAK